MVDIGVVAIGRNEGDRLLTCLESSTRQTPCAVYVDSGSTDDSVAAARRLGVEVVELDTTIPFTAARARNAGIARLLEIHPDLAYVQVVDGDCELVDGWIDAAVDSMSAEERLAVVCGRRSERHPEASVYNRICDMEWNTPVGPARSCGGDAVIRLEAWREVDGYDPSLICGEEPDMCYRMRRRGWTVRRLDQAMTRHDAAMTRFRQWWMRSIRSGWAYAEGAARHGRAPERFNVRERRSIWFWGLLLPVVVAATVWPTGGWSLVLLAGYPVLGGRVWRYRRQRGDPVGAAMVYAFFCVLGKFPQLRGQVRYHVDRWKGRESTLIEYKAPDRERVGSS